MSTRSRFDEVPRDLPRSSWPTLSSSAALDVPQNPFMSPNPFSNAHNDMYMSDTYATPGALGRWPVVFSTLLATPTNPLASGGFATFDRAGRMVASLIRGNPAMGTVNPQIVLLDPKTLQKLAAFDLPGETQSGDPATFRPAGVYFYQDEQDRTITGTANRTILMLSHTADAFTLEREYDLRGVIPDDDSLQALQPDSSGRVWFTSKGGVVGTLDLSTGKVLGTYQMPAGERIVNSHASDETGGVFIASSKAMHRFDADQAGAPTVTWREPYAAGTRVKPGQVDIGTGTTPTLMGTKYVTITDNADPRMHVLVYRRAKQVRGPRLTCSVPVFQAGRSATENSLVATNRSIVVENNYGYNSIDATQDGKTTTPGITRIDVNAKGRCRKAWTNSRISIPTVVTKLSVDNGLIYTYSKPAGPGTTDRWYFTAIDFRTGKVAYSQLAGTGQLYNNNYEPLYLGPDGTVYVGVFGGFVAMRDATRQEAKIIGTWAGVIRQKGVDPFRLTVTIGSLTDASRNVFHYTGINCSGTWKLLGRRGASYRFEERNDGQSGSKCINGGRVTLTPLGRDRLQFRYRGDDVRSRGTLSRR